MKYSLIIPVYKNELSIPRLLEALTGLHLALSNELEVVFVVDGSPDSSYQMLYKALDNLPFQAQLLAHSKNFGSFAAIRSGLQAAKGTYCSIMAADLQEPISLVQDFFVALESDECDVAIGKRTSRQDPWTSKIFSSLFWKIYQKFIVPEMPEGGVDIFGCNRVFKEQLLKLEESRSSLVALIFWLGFRRKFFEYSRLNRQEGLSAWTFRKKIDYMLDSIFAFTDLPVRLFINVGLICSLFSLSFGMLVLVAKLLGFIETSGYAATILLILFFQTVNLLGIGIVGTYSWRAYENSKHRPLSIVISAIDNTSKESGNDVSPSSI